MTDKPLIHPKKNQLIAFGLGKLEPVEAKKIETHLGECAACCETLLDLKDDTFVELVRKSPEPRQCTHANVSSANTEPADGVAPDKATGAETMLVGSGVSRRPADLPAQLENHLRYHIVELVGKGGMGDVYKAEHRLMNRPVALKLINQDLVKNTQAVERFRREVRAAARLTHPNIVTAHDAEQVGDVHFLVMEFVDGVDLASEVQNRGPLPTAEACDYIRQAALGLQHAHTRGMVHRDIKPDNLMLSSDGQVRILDFGLAGFATESTIIQSDATGATEGDTTPLRLTTVGSVMGTPNYIAPEQARDAHSADIRADIYSLGCTLCFLLTGKAPFDANSVIDKLKAHAEQDPPALDKLRDDVPAELADIVNRMMAKDPDDRIQSPAEVATALAPFTGGNTKPAVAPVQAPVRAAGNRRILTKVWAAALSTILLAGVIVVVTTQGNFEVQSAVDGVQVTVSKDGDAFRVLDVNSGTSVFWLPSGEFQVKARGNVDVTLSRQKVQISWMGRETIRIKKIPRSRAPAATDYERIQGSWIAESGLRGGQVTPVERIWMQQAVFEGEKLRILFPASVIGEKTIDGVFQLKMSANPRQFSIQAKGQTEDLRGIYKLEGDRLILCMSQKPQGQIPTEFSSKPGTTIDLIELRRGAPYSGPSDSSTTRGRSRFFDAVSRQDVGESVLNRIASFDKVQGSDVTFVGEFGAEPTHSHAYWVHGARIRLTATREIVGRYLSGLKGAVEATAQNHDVHLTDVSVAESEGHLAGFSVGYSDVGVTGAISAYPEVPPATGGSDESSWDILLTVREWSGRSRPAISAKPDYSVLKQAYDGHLFGSNGKLALSPGGELLATCGDAVRIWNVADATQRCVLALPSATSAVFLKHDPQLIAIGTKDVSQVDNSRGKVILWNYKLDAFVGELPLTAGEVHALALSPDGRQLAIGAHLNEKGQALLWDLKTFEQRILVDDEPVRHVAFTPDGKFVVSASGNERGTLRLFDVATGKEVAEHKNVLSTRKFIRALSISPDSKLLAVAGGNWREKDGRLLLLYLPELTIQRRVVRGVTEVQSVTFSPDGRFLATGMGSGDGKVFLLDVQTLQDRTQFRAYGPRPAALHQIVSDIAFTTDGRSLFTAADHESARLWTLPESLRSPTKTINDTNRRFGIGPIKAGVNLVNDPSLENTASGERFPITWGTGNLIPKSAWKFEVVEGGRTGKRAWMIEGNGSAATMPTNRSAVDHDFRYAARAWVKVESGMARLGLLYFDKNRHYLTTSLGASTARQGEWHRLTMIDDFANQPDAAYVSLALVMHGKGKAVFDDLEMTAFDAKSLPENFAAEYGSPAHDPALFDRWVGHWETTSEYKPTETSDARTVKGKATVRKLFDDRFLLRQWKSEDNDMEYLSLLGFDEHLGVYRISVFNSGGEVYERVGEWNAASQTLMLNVRHPLPGMTGISTDRFVDNDRVASKLLVRNSNGTASIDLQMTSTRKTTQVSDDIALSIGPATEPKELAVLQKVLAGVWTIQQTYKPSVRMPDGKTEVITERAEWVLGGRALMTRNFDEAHKMSSLSLMTWNPRQKAYALHYFAPTTFGGRWRIVWDDSSKELRRRATDMPAGWIGTAVNRLIDDSTMESQTLIKDDKAQVLMDSVQKMTRVK